MTEQEKNLLANLCGYSNERYTDKVKEGVSELLDKDKELSIDRKTLKRVVELFNKIPKEILGEDITNDEVFAKFLNYDTEVEQIKTEVKETLKIE